MGRVTEQQAKKTETLAIGGRFNGFRPESEKAVGKADMKEDQALQQLQETWRKFDYDLLRKGHRYYDIYDKVAAIVRDLEYSAEDVEGFSVALAGYREEPGFHWKSGLLLAALVNEGRDDDYLIHTAILGPVNFIGYRNRKNITVKGDVGTGAGMEMACGRMTIEGNAISSIGNDMKGGTIIVEGSVKGDVGYQMEGGVIRIRGDVELGCGDEMKSGEVHIFGEIGSIGHVFHGKIFHKGELVFSK